METKNTRKVSTVPGEGKDDGDGLRERILSGVDDLVMREGIQRTTMDRLAGHIGMSKKTIYTCFRSKHTLFEALLSRAMRSIETKLLSIRERTDLSTGGKLRLTRDTAIRRLSGLGMRMLDDLAHAFPEMWRKVDAKRAELLTAHFHAILSEGVERGTVRSDVDVQLATLLIVRTLSGVGRPQELMDQPYSISDYIRGVFSMLFTGVLSQSGVTEYFEEETKESST